VTLGDNPNYSVVSTNGILTFQKSIAVTVIADGKSKYTGMKILRLLLWLLVLSMAAYHQLYLATTASQFSNVGDYPIAVTLGANLTIVLFQLMVL
jgi:hypothetical protein